METYSVLLFVMIVGKVILFETCTSGSECPPHKPFCSIKGCVNACLEPFYKNNTDCVPNCGDWFVADDRTCVNECHPTQFIEEKLTMSLGPFIERKCVSVCPKYIFNTTCTYICPIGNHVLNVGGYTRDNYGEVYSINGNKICAEQCPDVYPFKQNITYQGESLTICTAECYMYNQNGYCVENCSSDSVMFNDTCVMGCPQSHPIANIDGFCRELCISTTIEDSMCACPENKQFVLNDTCVDDCGANMFHWYHNEKVFCNESCNGGEYTYNKSCVSECPRGTFTFFNECLHECPESFPYYCAFNADGKCDDRYFIFSCFETCPVGMFADWFACKKSCPYFTLNSACHDTCPSTHPLIYNNVIVYDCVRHDLCSSIIRQKNCLDVCPQEYFKQRDECIHVCGNDEYVVNGSCVNECPKEMISRKLSIKYSEIKDLGPYHYAQYQTVTQSQVTHECVDNCNSNEYQYNNTCVSACPSDQQYVTNRECGVGPCLTGYYYNMAEFIHCVDYCDETDFSFEKECMYVCLNSTFALNTQCLNVCPNNTFMAQDVKMKCVNPKNGCPMDLFYLYTRCVDNCPNDTYLLNNSCVYNCPKQYVAVGRNCLQSCPNNLPNKIEMFEQILKWELINGLWSFGEYRIHRTHCLGDCPDGYYKRINECKLFCEKDEYVFNVSCYNDCPNQMKSREFKMEYTELEDKGPTYYYDYHERYINTTKSQLTNKCVDTCGSNEYQYNNACVTACPNDKPYSTNRVCDIGPCTTKHYYNLTTIIQCVDACNVSDFIRYDECLYVCQNTTFAHNSECVSVCPSNTYVTKVVKTTCEHNCSESSLHVYTRCTENCPKGTYVYNDACVDFCPENYVTAYENCVTECPFDLPYTNETVIQINQWINAYVGWNYGKQSKRIQACVSDCKDHGRLLDLEKSYCVNSCPATHRYAEDNVCKSKCSKYLIENEESFGIECGETCPEGKLLFNNTCVTSCPDQAKYEYQRSCYKTCPSESPFGVTERHWDKTVISNRCIKQCEGSKLFLNGECVYSYECENQMLEFQGQCLVQCPSGYVYSFSEVCMDVANVRIAAIVILATLACICLYSWKIIRDCVWIWFFVFTSTRSECPKFPNVSKVQQQYQIEFENCAFNTAETEVKENDTAC